MNLRNNNAITTTLITVLPLFIAVGCASNSDKLAQTDSTEQADTNLALDETPAPHTQITPEPADHTAIANMEGYLAEALDSTETIAEAENEKTNLTLAAIESSADLTTQKTYDELLIEQTLADQADIFSEPASMDAKVVMPAPEKRLFHFSSGTHQLDTTEQETIKLHAEYVLQHPNAILVITGHTDRQGATDANQRLSELRAQSIAELLIAQGVAEEQLRVGGMGESAPLNSADNLAENRRVELSYQDSMVATNQ